MMGTRRQVVLALGLSAATLSGVGSLDAAGGPSQRARPPASLSCSRDHLTSFQGRVLRFTRGAQTMTLRVRTDEETTEDVVLQWLPAERPEMWMLLRGEPFTTGDWKQVETASGTLRADTRVIVWVCGGGAKPIVDWRPKEP